ncbi:hypothetical protein V5E97_07200 [Singulisphaera sp. Ch08]|uniref:Uncharacterized protein n=1 Tax=Singulisphaera sp. Ch08 TaxID=3120278 RepID=A0AAU7CLJ0_9BACT
MRRFATLALSLSLVLGLTATGRMLFAQDPEKKDASTPEVKQAETPKEDVKKADAPKDEAKKPEAPKDETPAPIPPEVEAKLEAARRAVAEAIVAAQDAGLVQTSIDPPPILDILITGRATDEKAIKDRTGVSTEVFGAWFTNYGKPIEGINAQKDVRIHPPTKGLQTFYDLRASILNKHIKAVRDAQAAAKPKEEPKKAEEPAKKEEMKKEEPKPAPAEEPKKEEAKKEEPKKEEAKKEEAKPAPAEESKKEEAKPAPAEEPKKEEAKPAPAEESKKEEAKPEEPKKEEAKVEEPKKEEAKVEEPKKEEAK